MEENIQSDWTNSMTLCWPVQTNDWLLPSGASCGCDSQQMHAAVTERHVDRFHPPPSCQYISFHKKNTIIFFMWNNILKERSSNVRAMSHGGLCSHKPKYVQSRGFKILHFKVKGF